MRRWHLGAAVVLATGTAAVLLVRGPHGDAPVLIPSLPPPRAQGEAAGEAPSVQAEGEGEAPSIDRPREPGPPGTALAGLDLTAIVIDDDGATAHAEGQRVAHLTVDAERQRTAEALLAKYHLPEAAAVLVDVAKGEILAYASHVEEGPKRDLCAEASAPSASVFKIVTGAALIEEAGLGPDTKQCYGGGEQRIQPVDLVDDPARDRWCTTLAGAMGRSTNAVFARLALRDLKPKTLETMAGKLGWNGPPQVDVPTATSTLTLPGDPLNYARTAAGFWNSTLSPLQAAYVSTAVARGGDAVRLRLLRSITDERGDTIYREASASPRRVIARETAEALTTMMETTVRDGTSFRAFHDRRGTAFLPGMGVAGKTGTLTDAERGRFYTWFTGFAPSRPLPGVRQVAVAVLVVNRPTWRVKANVIARELLREHFALQHVPKVSRPDDASRDREPIARRGTAEQDARD